ncbi:hypothetical protein [Mycolicibacterium chlorophenolicum]|nr:hypothetical protein [Mycolicibacterium chlorophenolicum]
MGELNQRINDVTRELNKRPEFDIPIIENFSEINVLTADRARFSFGRLSVADANPLAQALGGDVMSKIRRPGECNVRVETDTRWCPYYDEAYPQAGYFHAYVLGYTEGETEVYIHAPLDDASLWRKVAAAQLHSGTVCGARNQPDCDFYEDRSSWIDLQPFAIKRGESIPIVYICEECRDRMKVDGWTAQGYVGTGPMPWNDDGPKLLPYLDPFDGESIRPIFGDDWNDPFS